MRDHHDGQAEQFAQAQYQAVYAGGAVRVQPGGGLVQKQQLGVERQRTRQRGAFHHAAAQFRGVLRAYLGFKAGHFNLPGSDGVDQAIVQRRVFAQGQTDVFQHRERAEQSTMLEHHAPAPTQCQRVLLTQCAKFLAEYTDHARVRPVQHDHFAQQRGFTRTAAADDRDDFLALHRQVNALVHDMGPETRRHAAQFQHGFGDVGRRCHVTNPAR